VCRGLGLDTELAWAIGMGHDLGHTPFGHVGERILAGLMQEKGMKDRGFPRRTWQGVEPHLRGT
jgi:dGTP triphosphohydrolase